MSVKRYMNEAGRMVPRENGAWVIHSDYAALEAENARLHDLAHCGIDADGHPLEWRIMADHHRIGEEQLRLEVAALEARCAGLERERDALQAKLAAAEEALRLARERQGKRLEWIWDGLRAICAMDPKTEAERMQQWASDTLYGAATPEEWEPEVRALRMEEFKKRPPLAGQDEYMEDMLQVRGYANNRATVARAALADTTTGEVQP